MNKNRKNTREFSKKADSKKEKSIDKSKNKHSKRVMAQK